MQTRIMQLCEAAANHDVDTVKECLKQKGIDVNKFVKIGDYTRPALAHALNRKPDSEPRQLQTVDALLNANADIDAMVHDGQTALMWATDAGRPEIVRVLLEHGANTQIKTSGGYTALEFGHSGQAEVKKCRDLIRAHNNPTAAAAAPLVEKKAPASSTTAKTSATTRQLLDQIESIGHTSRDKSGIKTVSAENTFTYAHPCVRMCRCRR